MIVFSSPDGSSALEIKQELKINIATKTKPHNEYKYLYQILYLICDYPHKHYTFKHFEA